MAPFTVRPLSSYIGAEIGDIDISEPLDDESVEALRSTLFRWKVLFFRDQELDHTSHIAFGRQFGELTYAHPHEDAPPDGYPEIYTVDSAQFRARFGARDLSTHRSYSYTQGWHTDVTPAINPPAGSILRADVVPEYGGDTTFTSLVAAYEGLSPQVRAFLDGLRAEHFYGAGTSRQPVSDSYRERKEKTPLVAHHPVVRVHPYTGERILFVNPIFTDHIVDVSPAESRWILDLLFHHITRPEYTVRFMWEPGSVAFWDNRAVAHLGPQDLGTRPVDRILHRVTLIGEVPVGTDGLESELIAGVPFRTAPLYAVTTS